jgi:hypothetical protein
MAGMLPGLMPMGIVDRVEGEWVVLEVEGQEVRRPRKTLAAGCGEGDVVNLETGEVDVEATREATAAAEAALDKSGPREGGSFDL